MMWIKPATAAKNLADEFFFGFASLVAGFRTPRDNSVRFSDSAAFIAGSFQAFVGDFRPELL